MPIERHRMFVEPPGTVERGAPVGEFCGFVRGSCSFFIGHDEDDVGLCCHCATFLPRVAASCRRPVVMSRAASDMRSALAAAKRLAGLRDDGFRLKS